MPTCNDLDAIFVAISKCDFALSIEGKGGVWRLGVESLDSHPIVSNPVY